MLANDVGQSLQSDFAETIRGGLPFADHIPPAAVGAVIPARVDAKDVGADARCTFDQWQLLVDARVTEQRIHIIVVNHQALRSLEFRGTTQLAGLGRPQGATLQRHFRNGILPVTGNDGERYRHGFEIVAFA